MKPGVVSAGADRAIVRLASGEYLAVDPNTVDAINYLVGRPVEPHIAFVFRCFLHPHAVVLDIGANFGLYTAITAGVIRTTGRLFAFEGNPHTFAYLNRTLYANGVINNPNIAIVNRLVSHQCGRGTLNFLDRNLATATMSDLVINPVDLDRWGMELRSVEVEMTTIDAFLPDDLAVDLVKIDVEGHEPYVLMGMEQTIARSPNLRIVIEYIDALLAETTGAVAFADYIRGLGLHICEIGKDWRLRPCPPGVPLPGNTYLLLTRTPEADIASVARRRFYPRAELKRFLQRLSVGIGELGHRL
ncbi:MAG TPA: FkbM family methyltransferase [Stellaceae bacterium]|nr:FkbM family methyltransferase [Stellaceae bacterium]